MTTELVPAVQNLPDFLKNQETVLGNENVNSSDVTVPRIEVVQSLSPARNKRDPQYIEGCEEGDLYNSLTRELYGKSIHIIPVYYLKEYIVWKDRSKGGGFRGVANTLAEARVLAQMEPDCEAVETPQQFVLLVKPDGTFEEAVISMPKTKGKPSRKLNSLVKMTGKDRFAGVYELSSMEENSDKGNYFNYDVKQVRWVSEPEYNRAKRLYEILVAGGRVADRSGLESDTATSGEF